MSLPLQVKEYPFKGDMRLVSVTDAHLGSPTFEEKAFRTTVNYIKNNDAVYCFFDGDCTENITPDCVAVSTDQVMPPDQQIECFMDYMTPIKHRILFGVRGNHLNRTRKKAHFDPMIGMCKRLGVDYLGVGGYVKLLVGKQVYTIAVQHGANGSANWETEMKRMRGIYPLAEAIFLGHDHNLTFEHKPYLTIDPVTKTEVQNYCIFSRTGNYLGYAEYARDKIYELKITGSINTKFHANKHFISGYKMMYINGEPLYDTLNLMGNKKKIFEVRA